MCDLLRAGLRFCAIPLQDNASYCDSDALPRISLPLPRSALPFRYDALPCFATPLLRLAVHFHCSAKNGCSFPLPCEGVLRLAVPLHRCSFLCLAAAMRIGSLHSRCVARLRKAVPFLCASVLIRRVAPHFYADAMPSIRCLSNAMLSRSILCRYFSSRCLAFPLLRDALHINAAAYQCLSLPPQRLAIRFDASAVRGSAGPRYAVAMLRFAIPLPFTSTPCRCNTVQVNASAIQSYSVPFRFSA